MFKLYIYLFVLGMFQMGFSQELKCTISINSTRAVTANQQILNTLERSLNDFVNKTKWTNNKVLSQEKIECSMFINIADVQNTSFTASIQVQSSRPIYGSNYQSPVFNFNDEKFSFQYVEFENLFFNPNSTNSNLVAVVAFYVHMILGFDADTYQLEGGTKYYQTAQSITDLSQQSGYSGWSQADGNQTRFTLINDLLKGANRPYRKILYDYHMTGMDFMSSDVASAKGNVVKAISNLDEVYKTNSSFFLIRVFFDAKSDEIQQMLIDGPKIDTNPVKLLLNKMSPINTVKWNKIKS